MGRLARVGKAPLLAAKLDVLPPPTKAAAGGRRRAVEANTIGNGLVLALTSSAHQRDIPRPAPGNIVGAIQEPRPPSPLSSYLYLRLACFFKGLLQLLPRNAGVPHILVDVFCFFFRQSRGRAHPSVLGYAARCGPVRLEAPKRRGSPSTSVRYLARAARRVILN